MAFLEKLEWAEGNSFLADGCFNIDMSVGGSEYGSGCPATNRQPDMQLVFYLLWNIYLYGDKKTFPNTSKDKFVKTPKDHNYNSPEMKKAISSAIWRFQTDLLRSGKLVFRDGRCDKAKGTMSSISKTRYTIHHANFNYAAAIKQKYNRADWQNYLLSDPILPEQARQEILMRMIVH